MSCDEEAHRHEQRGRRKRTGAPLGDNERVEQRRAGAGEEHGKDQLNPAIPPLTSRSAAAASGRKPPRTAAVGVS